MTGIRIGRAALCLAAGVALCGRPGEGAAAPPGAGGRGTGGFPGGWEVEESASVTGTQSRKAAPRTDGFPDGWEVEESASVTGTQSRKAAAFPDGWELPEETAAAAARARAAAGTRSLSATAAVSSTVSAEAELAKARFQVGKAGNMLGRLKATGYQVLVKDDLQAIEGLLGQARQALAAGNAPETRRLADEAARGLQKAKVRIEAETQQPLRW